MARHVDIRRQSAAAKLSQINGRDDVRNAWPARTSALTGRPVVNGAVSGQGWYGAFENLERDVFVLDGVTDCAVLLGTNDLGANTACDKAREL